MERSDNSSINTMIFKSCMTKTTESFTERHKYTNRQIHRHVGTQTDIQTGRQIHGLIDRQIDWQILRQMNRGRDRN